MSSVQRTYELISALVSERSDVHIEYDDDGPPRCDTENKRIILPTTIKDENMYGALALVIHEAGHIKHTIFDGKEMSDSNKDKFDILNAVEDSRIDQMNFNILPNIKTFYEQLYKKPELSDKFHVNVLIYLIYKSLGFMSKLTKQHKDLVKPFIIQHGLESWFIRLAGDLMRLEDQINWEDQNPISSKNSKVKKYTESAKASLNELYKILHKTPPPQPQPQPQQGPSQSTQDGQGKQAPGPMQATPDKSDKSGNKSNPDANQGTQPKEEQGPKALGNSSEIENLTRVSASILFSQDGSSNVTRSPYVTSIMLHESTRAKFKELLNIKLNHQVEEGNTLNTDSLTSYFTGDIDGLFVNDHIEKKKKSKILFLLDSSGSMQYQMPINNRGEEDERRTVLSSVTHSIEKIVEEVRSLEGNDVDFEVDCFDNDYYELGKDWPEKYMTHGGGTNLLMAFDRANSKLMNDPEIDGQRILILFTDGEVNDEDIKGMNRSMMVANSQVKMLIVGIGAQLNGAFVKEVVGDNNILSKKFAEETVADAVMSLL